MDIIRAFLLIFVAEMGDKTQILAMTFATKYKVRQVLLGVFIGSFLNHAIAVFLGSNFKQFLPLDTLAILAGILFIVFGLWNLFMDQDENESPVQKYGPILTVALAFFLGELGDKTQLTAIVLSVDSNPVLTLIGTVTGMVVTSMLGIFVGMKIGNRLDEFYIKIGASFIFFIFGFTKLYQEEFILTSLWIDILFVFIIVMGSYFILRPSIKLRRTGQSTSFQQAATRLHNFYSDMYDKIDDICLGIEVCKVCGGKDCLVGYTRMILAKAKNGSEVVFDFPKEELKKDFNHIKVLEAYRETLNFLKNHYEDPQMTVVHEVRKTFEQILYKHTIEASTYLEFAHKLHSIDPKLITKI